MALASIHSMIPNAEDLLALEPEELATVLHLNSYDEYGQQQTPALLPSNFMANGFHPTSPICLSVPHASWQSERTIVGV